MKYKWILLILASVFLFLHACDEIEKPYVRDNGGGDDNGNGGGDDDGKIVRKIFLEDFTGHKCVNCPKAHKIVDELKADYGDSIITIAIHAGTYATPESEGHFTADYRSQVGGELQSAFGVQFYPAGLINRQDEGALFNSTSWKSEILSQIGQEAIVAIDIMPEFDDSNGTLDTDVTVTFTEHYEGAVNLCVFITENGLISPQENNVEDVGPTPTIEDYEHNHVLRASLNGTWGEPVTTEDILADMLYEQTFSGYDVSEDWNPDNLDLVAFVYDQTTMEVLQVEKTAVK